MQPDPTNYNMLQSSLQILHSALLDDWTLRAGDLKSGSVLSRGSISHQSNRMCLNVYMLYVH